MVAQVDLREGYSNECMRMEGRVCIGNNTVIDKNSRRDNDESIFAYFNFDNEFGSDMSINGVNHLKYDPSVLSKLIPSFNGQGFSQELSESKFLTLNISNIGTNTFSLNLWVFLVEQDQSQNQQLFLTYADNIQNFDIQLYLTPYGNLNLKTKDRQITRTNSRLRQRQWNRLSINIIDNQKVQVILNSKVDIDLNIDQPFDYGQNRDGSKAIYIGGDPWHDASGYKAFIDDLRVVKSQTTVRSQAQSMREIYTDQQLFNLQNADLGCKSIVFDQAHDCCPSSKNHICDDIELTQFGYGVAKFMGWIDQSEIVRVFTAEMISNKQYKPDFEPLEKGLVICCKNNQN
ncbi:UNKNOWN [Stylonychia lemnae]|uniref:DUF8019 domain-containing protein n=1 Tax=Stylonychia lemnae TaxID=5949 RepID=A0A078AA83_STYLE|nr:UNKNOWN [Stylonychia lemnae]|eukprot:CDW79104.1 UNKNOWN [Stylonychia lemnae]